jgi:hypothetical protein
LSFVQERCRELGVAPGKIDALLESHSPEQVLQQIEWLPYRRPRDPAAMLVSAVRGDWTRPAQLDQERVERAREHDARSLSVPPESQAGDVDEDVAELEGRSSSEQDPPDASAFSLPGTGLDAREVWMRVLEELRMQMTRAAFDTWLGGSEVVRVQDGRIAVCVRDEYAVEWLTARWGAPIQRTLTGIVGHPVIVQFEVPL